MVLVTQQITVIETHEEPHLDELVAIFLLREFGTEVFPGADTAKLVFRRRNIEDMAKTADEMEADGILLIGMGGGRFDEHAVGDKPRSDGHSAASLMAEAIGCDKLPSLRGLIKYATDCDLGGGDGSFGLAKMVGLLNFLNPNDPLKVWSWTCEALRAHQAHQKTFFRDGKMFRSHARVVKHPYGDKTIKVASIQTDAKLMKAYAFSQFGGLVDVLIQRNRRGNIQIFSRGVDLKDLPAMIRAAELEKRGITINDDLDLSAAGTMAKIPMWHYFPEGRMLLNGSNTARQVEESKLSLKDVQTLALKALVPQMSEATA
ncbi:MAG: hypothetical protein NVSMB39_2830 [Candidatus Saccharimonadales bacterium]